MNRFFSLSAPALVLGLGLAGCVGSGGIDGINSARTTEQQVEVHAILDHREIAGVGCLLENDAGRWFVLAPGRVTVTRSSQPLAVSCKRDGVGSADESWSAHHQSGPLVGTILFNAGLRNYLQAGYAYATILTVNMRPARTDDGGADTGTPVY